LSRVQNTTDTAVNTTVLVLVSYRKKQQYWFQFLKLIQPYGLPLAKLTSELIGEYPRLRTFNDTMHVNTFCCVENGLQEALKEIDNVQLKIDQMNEQASDEILAVERRYVKLRLPLYEVCNGADCLLTLLTERSHVIYETI